MAEGQVFLRAAELEAGKKKIQDLAVQQLLHVWQKAGGRNNDPFLWGDEVECLLLRLDSRQKRVKLEHVPWQDLESEQRKMSNAPSLQPELGTFMLETTPGEPFGPHLGNLLLWEEDLRKRRQLVNGVLGNDGWLVTLPYYPRYGAISNHDKVNDSVAKHRNPVTWSNLVSDNDIAAKDRFKSILGNVIEKRGTKIDIQIPIYRDTNTPWPWKESNLQITNKTTKDEMSSDEKKNVIHMDSTIFGATGCSLQITMQARNIHQARILHDQLIPLAPVMLALTAGTPIFRGYLADTDTRWECFVQSMDDRTSEEQLQGKPARSRVSTSTDYIAEDPVLLDRYQLPDLEIEESVKEVLSQHGMDDRLATHFAHIYSRDPLFASGKDLEEADDTKTLMADSLLSNVYQLVRFKPPNDDRTGWRVEFRPMEAQITDFENVAFGTFIILAAKTVLSMDLNLYVPLIDVEHGLNEASKMDAARTGQFTFRSTSVQQGSDRNVTEFKLMTANEIINGVQDGQKNRFQGMIPLIRTWLSEERDLSDQQQRKIDEYLQLISDRASGRSSTTAHWIRDFVQHHKDYRNDSVVSESVIYELVRECIKRNEN